MSAGDHLGKQFYEMTQHEFEQQPGTWFHGSPTGVPGGGGGAFHVGTAKAAQQALIARVNVSGDNYKENVAIHRRLAKARPGGPIVRQALQSSAGSFTVNARGEPVFVSDPSLTAGRIVGPMTNTPVIDSRRGPPRSWEVRTGIQKGAMIDWPRISKSEPMSDVRANAIAPRLKKHGVYYVNAAEDAGSISAVIPTREHFKTHEDYLVEAREQGKKIPKRALRGYKQIPGQGKMF